MVPLQGLCAILFKILFAYSSMVTNHSLSVQLSISWMPYSNYLGRDFKHKVFCSFKQYQIILLQKTQFLSPDMSNILIQLIQDSDKIRKPLI